jgi:hypothetical protein
VNWRGLFREAGDTFNTRRHIRDSTRGYWPPSCTSRWKNAVYLSQSPATTPRAVRRGRRVTRAAAQRRDLNKACGKGRVAETSVATVTNVLEWRLPRSHRLAEAAMDIIASQYQTRSCVWQLREL